MKFLFTLFFSLIFFSLKAQPTVLWDSIKAATSPMVAPALANDYEIPYRQPLSAYGWEDGIHISRDGLNLYALYYPGDLYSWTVFFLNNLTNLTACELLGNTDYFRPYAETFGMDMTTNALGCDTFINIDILYAHRPSLSDGFTHWQLSGIARPGAPEGGSYPLFSDNNPSQIDIFLFTATSDIWMIRNTTANPTGIANAVRLPYPVNPITDEFSADNPHLEKLNGDTLLLVYEKYTNLGERNFVYTFSYDDGYTWTNPVPMTTLSTALGHIEHPHLYKNPQGQWYMYFSINCEIYRAIQGLPSHWDSWQNIELVIAKGNSPCIGEPSLTANGDISFAVAYENHANNDTTDSYDIDPWFLPSKGTHHICNSEINPTKLNVYPNPITEHFTIEATKSISEVNIYDVTGRLLYNELLLQEVFEKTYSARTLQIGNGFYIIRVKNSFGDVSIDRIVVL